MDLKRELKRYIQNQVDDKVKWHAREHESQIADMVQKIIDDSDYDNETFEHMTEVQFQDVLENDVDIAIYKDNRSYLHWIYDEPDITQDDVIRDMFKYNNVQDLVESKFNDDTYQFENGLIIILGF